MMSSSSTLYFSNYKAQATIVHTQPSLSLTRLLLQSVVLLGLFNEFCDVLELSGVVCVVLPRFIPLTTL